MNHTISLTSGWGLAALLVALPAAPARCQDPVLVAPAVYCATLDDAHARVLDIRLAPGQKSPLHSHPDYVVHVLSPGRVRFTSPDGKSTELELKAGESMWRAAETHSVENIGKTEIHALNVETKLAHAATLRDHVTLGEGDLVWTAAPRSLPPGARMALLEGDPKQPGPFTIRVKTAGEYRVPAHWHPADEHVTVIQGSLNMGLGDKLDETAGHKLPAGGFAAMPAGIHHFAWTKEPTVVQIHGIGPWGIEYVNPADDPRLQPQERASQAEH